MTDRDGHEPREPSRYELLEQLRAELDKRDIAFNRRLEEVLKNQETMTAKLLRWETGAAIIRWLAISTAGFVASALALFEWARSHYR